MKDLQVKEAALPPSVLPSLADYGYQEVTKNDIMIPKILAMQMMSVKVAEDKAKFGELRDSMNYSLLGGFTQACEFIPFFLEKVWVEYTVTEQGGKKTKEYLRQIPITTQNEELPYQEPGLERDRTLNFYCLLASQPNGMAHVISFRRTSLKAGIKVSTQMFIINRDANKLPCATVFKLSTEKKVNTDTNGSYAVMNVEVSRAATVEEQVACVNWSKRVKGGQTKVDHSDIVEEVKASSVIHDTETDQF